ncbi:MAG: hypothetical protein AAF849_23880 [Bacteroidota bacterium]
MAKREDFISILCLYSAQDEDNLSLLEQHFELLYNNPNDYFSDITYLSIESYQDWYTEQDVFLESVDIILVLLSTHLMNAPYTQSYQFKSLFKMHYNQSLSLVPIYLKAVDLEGTRFDFENVDIFPSSEHPILSAHWKHPDVAMRQVVEAIKPISEKMRTRKRMIEAAWERATSLHTTQSYRDYLNRFPISPHKADAEERRDALLEDDLWANALKKNRVATYLEYLNDAPLQDHAEEAKQNIIEIEASEAAAWQDAVDNDEMAFYFNYKGRFSDEAKEIIANEEIEEYMKRPLDEFAYATEDEREQALQSRRSFNTESNHLTYLALRQLNSEEQLALILMTQYIQALSRKVLGVKRHFEGRAASFRMYAFYILTVVLLYVAAFSLYPKYFELIGNFLKFYLPFSLLLACLGVWFYLVPEINKDVQFCKEKATSVQQTEVGLKMAFLQYDERGKRQIMNELYFVEQQMKALKAKPNLDYFKFS